MSQPLAYFTKEVGNTMYYQKAVKQPDAIEFVKKIIKKINGHVDNRNWKLIDRSMVVERVDVIPYIWSMRCNCNLETNQVTKYKACLILHGGKKNWLSITEKHMPQLLPEWLFYFIVYRQLLTTGSIDN